MIVLAIGDWKKQKKLTESTAVAHAQTAYPLKMDEILYVGIGFTGVITREYFGEDRLRGIGWRGIGSNFAILPIHSSSSLQTLQHYRVDT